MVSANAESFPFADLALARRLERCEGRSNAGFVEARAKLFPDSSACWIEVAGAFAMFDGVASPLTQTFGLGLFETPTSAALEEMETFFRQRGAPVFHEICPVADGALLTLLNGRGYQPFEFTNVLFRPIRSGIQLTATGNARIHVRLPREGDQEAVAQTTIRGWSETPEISDFLQTVVKVSAHWKGAHTFLAELDGQPIATGALSISEGVALLAGASTVPEGRKQGAQLALLESRLRFAADQDCDLAMMGAIPGSGSQRNAERHGFRIAYTRVKWRLGNVP